MLVVKNIDDSAVSVPRYRCNRYQGIASNSLIRFCYSVVRGTSSLLYDEEQLKERVVSGGRDLIRNGKLYTIRKNI